MTVGQLLAIRDVVPGKLAAIWHDGAVRVGVTIGLAQSKNTDFVAFGRRRNEFLTLTDRDLVYLIPNGAIVPDVLSLRPAAQAAPDDALIVTVAGATIRPKKSACR